MTPSALTCPFCHAGLGPRDAVCPQCRATRRVRTGMSPRGFTWFVTSWLALAVPVVLLALWMALVPWLPQGEAPGYALALVGAKPVEPPARCRMEVLDASGRRTEVVTEGACGASAATRPAAAPSLTRQRAAAALHSLASLGTAALLVWALLRLLRKPFLQRSAPSWVRRSTTARV